MPIVCVWGRFAENVLCPPHPWDHSRAVHD
jgi:hypothetical protein